MRVYEDWTDHDDVHWIDHSGKGIIDHGPITRVIDNGIDHQRSTDYYSFMIGPHLCNTVLYHSVQHSCTNQSAPISFCYYSTHDHPALTTCISYCYYNLQQPILLLLPCVAVPSYTARLHSPTWLIRNPYPCPLWSISSMPSHHHRHHAAAFRNCIYHPILISDKNYGAHHLCIALSRNTSKYTPWLWYNDTKGPSSDTMSPRQYHRYVHKWWMTWALLHFCKKNKSLMLQSL